MSSFITQMESNVNGIIPFPFTTIAFIDEIYYTLEKSNLYYIYHRRILYYGQFLL